MVTSRVTGIEITLPSSKRPSRQRRKPSVYKIALRENHHPRRDQNNLDIHPKRAVRLIPKFQLPLVRDNGIRIKIIHITTCIFHLCHQASSSRNTIDPIPVSPGGTL